MKKYLFLDVETTGLDPEKDLLLEVAAAVVTADDLEIIAHYEAVIRPYYAGDFKSLMCEYVTTMHTKSGLLEEIDTFGGALVDAEQNLIELIDRNFDPSQMITLAGNSIHFDRSFIKMDMPKLDKILDYRMIDVSSFGIIARDYLGFKPVKKNAHRAMADVLESIEELRAYRNLFKSKEEITNG